MGSRHAAYRIGTFTKRTSFSIEAAPLFLTAWASQPCQNRRASATKKFAEDMIADHTKAGQEMMPAAKADKVKVPEKLDQKHQARLDALKAADKSAFDAMYRAEQLKAHETAAALFSDYAKNGEKGGLKTFAAKTLPTLEQHLAEVQKMKVAL
ncbi:DUF4142 domain-containing protein [Phyllobacterium sp. KW56]|nr:DUF4142 domain-containing protein [Phyllobacterium sp. KW56]MBZ9605836.1 DUF4142 domain-containing protein [Phyllobacterium sp. KW56]